MTDKDPFDAHVGQHIGRRFARKGSITLDPAILRTHGNIGTKGRSDRLQVHLRRTHNDFRVLAQGGLVEHGDKVGRLLDGTIALPVTTHKEFTGFSTSRSVEGTTGQKSEVRRGLMNWTECLQEICHFGETSKF